MPGHKGNAPFGPADLYALDTTELPGTDDLYTPQNGLRLAQEAWARAAGAACTLLLHNGSTVGLHVMLQLYAREGDTVLLPRSAHLSAVNGCIMGGLRVRWIPVRQEADGTCRTAEQDVLQAMAEHPEARAVLLTRPDYYGRCLPMENIVRRARQLGMRVLVDEAHGAHLPWLEQPASAGALGADAWVQSVHKTLPGLTGAAVLHLARTEDQPRALQLLRRHQTSSPSFLLMQSADDARAWMDQHGRHALAEVVRAADGLRVRLPQLGYRDAHALWRAECADALDPTRLVIEAPQGGAALAEQLQARGVDVEMHDLRRVVLILTAMDAPEDVRALADVLAGIPVNTNCEAALPLPELPPMPGRVMEVRAAAMAEAEYVPLTECAGRIAAVPAGVYPPGVPLVCPGECITQAVVQRLAKAGEQERFGVEGDRVLCVSV